VNAAAAERWIVKPRPNSLARVRMFCFPIAGGNASAFANWPDALPDDVEVCAVQYPGRQQRAAEPPFTRMPLAIHSLEKALGEDYLDLPYAIFGTCTGSFAAYELAQRIVRVHGLQPAHLFISCCRAPHLPDRDAPIHALPEAAMWAELERLGGTPATVSDHPELRALLSPILRADFQLAETYHYRELPPLACPLTAFGGVHDPIVAVDELEPWRAHTTGPFERRMLQGGHYLLDTASDELLRELAQALAEDGVA